MGLGVVVYPLALRQVQHSLNVAIRQFRKDAVTLLFHRFSRVAFSHDHQLGRLVL